MPNSTQEDLLKHPVLHLSELRENFVGRQSLCKKRYKKACAKWGDYFQSPVDKAAQTLNSAFRFNEFGAFMDGDTDFETAKKALLAWLQIEGGDDLIEGWLRTGEPLPTEKLDIVRRKLRNETLTNDSLYDQPICRLVHRDQLRRDLDYQVIYQVTPGQSKLLNPQQDPRERPSAEPQSKRLKRNQKTYWGISETFQSLVAMFDSDLGTWRDSKDPDKVTKEFIRITSEKEPSAAPLTPDELNIYSPLRFWSPPPAFAGSVFHMLFWRAIITGKDLFGRDVVKLPPTQIDEVKSDHNSIADRARQYYVIINWFNAAKFRLAAYDRLFETLMAIASFVGSNRRGSDPRLCEIKRDFDLRDQTLTDLLYPNYLPHQSVKFREFEPLNLKLPFRAVDKPIWELAWGHHSEEEKEEATRISHLLKFIRDKALELIIWSKYQMEIRSVGLIPCQYLYRVELNPNYTNVLEELARKYEPSNGGAVVDTTTSHERSQQRLQINASIIEAIENESIKDWVILRRVSGGTNRTVFDKEAWHAIECLKSPRAASSRI